MTGPEQQLEQRSSIKISQNAKGDPQVEVKVVDGFDHNELTRVQTAAVKAFNDTVTAVRVQ